jgi:hypothetical protein
MAPPVHNGHNAAGVSRGSSAATAGPKTLRSGVRWRGRLLGPACAVAELRPSLALFVYDVFWLLSLCCYRDQFLGRCRVVATQGRRVWLWLLCRTFFV